MSLSSTELKCKMNFAIYLPPKAENGKCPVLYWLSGLTCMEQNFITNAGRQLLRMESSSLHQTPAHINANFPTDPEKMSISGHSMGGGTEP